MWLVQRGKKKERVERSCQSHDGDRDRRGNSPVPHPEVHIKATLKWWGRRGEQHIHAGKVWRGNWPSQRVPDQESGRFSKTQNQAVAWPIDEEPLWLFSIFGYIYGEHQELDITDRRRDHWKASSRFLLSERFQKSCLAKRELQRCTTRRGQIGVPVT